MYGDEYCVLHRDVLVGQHYYDAYGNLALLETPMLAVHCRSNWDFLTTVQYGFEVLRAADFGATLVGAFVSRAEQDIMDYFYMNEHRYIRITHVTLGENYCLNEREALWCRLGRLLVLAPWRLHVTVDRTREVCVAMNKMADVISHTTRVNFYNGKDEERISRILKNYECGLSCDAMRNRLYDPLRFRGEDGRFIYPLTNEKK